MKEILKYVKILRPWHNSYSQNFLNNIFSLPKGMRLFSRDL